MHLLENNHGNYFSVVVKFSLQIPDTTDRKLLLLTYLFHILHKTDKQSDYLYLLTCRLQYICFFMSCIGPIYKCKQFYCLLFQTLTHGIFVLFAKILCKLKDCQKQIIRCFIYRKFVIMCQNPKKIDRLRR